jgi:hypothetical protein
MPTQTPASINRFFAAMQGGASCEDEMLDLFHDEAIYIEPFSGKIRTHTGKTAIRDVMRDGWRHPMPDMRIEMDRINVDGEDVRVAWTCYSPALPGGQGKGENLFRLKDGLIERLETRIVMANG